MRIPRKIDVHGKPCKIVFKKNLMCKEDEVDGVFHAEGFYIELDVALKKNPEKLLHTLLHELGHALLYRLYINDGLPSEVEEAIVEGYANLLTERFSLELL